MQTIIRTLKEALTSAQHPTSHRPLYDDREVRSIVDLLIEEVCDISHVDRIVHPELQPSAHQREQLQYFASQLAMGIPVQQVLGYERFCGRRFRVTPEVLIPRPETAELVEWIRTTCREVLTPKAPLRILDLGTGSGCISITLARLINNSQVLAADLSTAALSVAQRNAYEQGVDNIQFVHCDILKLTDEAYLKQVFNNLSTTDQTLDIAGNEHALSLGCPPPALTCQPSAGKPQITHVHNFDIIVSNPPYICRSEASEMSSLVLDNEPAMALFVPDDDPLLFYRAIARMARLHLSPDGFLFFEINAAYGPDTCQMLNSEGFVRVELRQDINGRDRMIRAKLG